MDFYEKLIKSLLEGVNEDELRNDSKEEERKFRKNVGKFMRKLIFLKEKDKIKVIRAMKAACFALISEFPIITPVITAILQAITTEDLGTKIDEILKEIRLGREEHKVMVETLKEILNK